MTLRFVTTNDYGAVPLLTTTQPQADKIPRVLGAIVGFIIQTTSGGGTGAPDAAKITAFMINQLKITDVNRNQILDLQGLDIPFIAFNNSLFGTYTAGTAVAQTNPAGPDEWFLRWPVKVADQPLTVSLTLDTRAAVTGGATCSAMTGDVVITVVYDDASDPTASLRELRLDSVVVNGTYDWSRLLGQNLTTVHIVIRNPTTISDAHTTNLTLEANGQVQVETMTVASFTAWEAEHTVSGHQASLYPLPMTAAFVANATTSLKMVGTTAETYRLFQFYI